MIHHAISIDGQQIVWVMPSHGGDWHFPDLHDKISRELNRFFQLVML